MGRSFSVEHFLPRVTQLAADPGFRVRKVSDRNTMGLHASY